MRTILNDGQIHEGILLKSNEYPLITLNKNGPKKLKQEKGKRIEEQSEKNGGKIVIKDGTSHEEYKMTDGPTPATIYREGGIIKSNPNRVKRISQNKDSSDYTFENPLPNIYFISPSAIPLKEGASYYQNQSSAFNSFQTALNKNISIGGGIEFLSLFFNRSPSIYGNLKISGSASSRFHYGGGLFSGAGLTRDDFSPVLFAAPYAVFTLGGPDHSYTFGNGTILTNESEYNNNWFFNISVMDRMTEKVSVISNNFLSYNGFSIPFYVGGIQGFRIMGESRAVDIGFIITAGGLLFDLNLLLPYAGFIQRF